MPADALHAHLSDLADQAAGSNLHRRSVLRSKEDHIREDLQLFSHGILDLHSMLAGYVPHEHPVEVAFRHADGELYALRRQANLQVDDGRNGLERGSLFSDIAANAAFAAIKGQATASSATTLTVPTGIPTTGGLNGSMQGHVVYVGPNSSGAGSQVYGVLMSDSATVLTVDQWYDPTSTSGASGTTPNATGFFIITAGCGVANWIGLSTDATTAAAADVLRTADGLFGTGTSGSGATEQTANGLARTFVLPTFPATHQTQLQNTWTYTGTGAVTLAKVVLANSKAAAGSKLHLETLLSATGTVTANGDTIQATWTINN
jgi:hypothetical protein